MIASGVEIDKAAEDATHQNGIFGEATDGPARLITRPADTLIERLVRAGLHESVLDLGATPPDPVGPYD